ncbi:MAG: argininosuccinate lyase [Coriobacteriales bacterium]|jgi:argininosuccinate lyase|nr:argininosuccinate lyase [Coriobacteriales bacterium]
MAKKTDQDTNSNLWGGRFEGAADQEMLVFGASLPVDMNMLPYDIMASIAHATMLGKQGIITADEAQLLVKTLTEVGHDIAAGKVELSLEDEDIHMAVEGELIRRIGEVGKKLHTGRSRNDQVVTDFRLFCRSACSEVIDALLGLMTDICDLAEANIGVIMPGYTHMQKAQPVLFSHHLLAYFWMLNRDLERFEDAAMAASELPLGAAALAGSTFDLDRELVADALDFVQVAPNSMDAVSNRDFALDCDYACAMVMMHYSRLCEELVLWSSDEFGFITLADAYSTGSSIMPQKKNPDYAELTRGKTGRVYATLIGLLTTMKGLPLAYNKDLQEDKEGLFDAVQTVLDCTGALDGMLTTMQVNSERMLDDAQSGFMAATDLADHLVRSGMPFRDAHHIVGQIVHDLEKQGKDFRDLSLEGLKAYAKEFDDLRLVDIRHVLEGHDTFGGTSTRRVREQLELAHTLIADYDESAE